MGNGEKRWGNEGKTMKGTGNGKREKGKHERESMMVVCCGEGGRE